MLMSPPPKPAAKVGGGGKGGAAVKRAAKKGTASPAPPTGLEKASIFSPDKLSPAVVKKARKAPAKAAPKPKGAWGVALLVACALGGVVVFG